MARPIEIQRANDEQVDTW